MTSQIDLFRTKTSLVFAPKKKRVKFRPHQYKNEGGRTFKIKHRHRTSSNSKKGRQKKRFQEIMCSSAVAFAGAYFAIFWCIHYLLPSLPTLFLEAYESFSEFASLTSASPQTQDNRRGPCCDFRHTLGLSRADSPDGTTAGSTKRRPD